MNCGGQRKIGRREQEDMKEEGKRKRRYERGRGNDDEEEREGGIEAKRRGQQISVTRSLVL